MTSIEEKEVIEYYHSTYVIILIIKFAMQNKTTTKNNQLDEKIGNIYDIIFKQWF